MILEAPLHDKDCVLGNILAAHYLSSCDPSKVNLYVKSASSKLVSLLFIFTTFSFEEDS